MPRSSIRFFRWSRRSWWFRQGSKLELPLNSQLRKYGRNLTEEALNGGFDPVVGREKEVRRIIQILGRRQGDNPLLLGDAGVGKTAVVEFLAQLIARDCRRKGKLLLPDFFTGKSINFI
jgi:ATP-dependent Clp protease ATP-binding subunit ClpA